MKLSESLQHENYYHKIVNDEAFAMFCACLSYYLSETHKMLDGRLVNLSNWQTRLILMRGWEWRVVEISFNETSRTAIIRNRDDASRRDASQIACQKHTRRTVFGVAISLEPRLRLITSSTSSGVYMDDICF